MRRASRLGCVDVECVRRNIVIKDISNSENQIKVVSASARTSRR